MSSITLPRRTLTVRFSPAKAVAGYFDHQRKLVSLVGDFVIVYVADAYILLSSGVAEPNGVDRETIRAIRRRGPLVIDSVRKQHHRSQVAPFVVRSDRS